MIRGMRERVMLAVVALALGAGTARAQAPVASAPVDTVPANPADVASLDAIVAVLYDVISGPAGQKRDWNRFMSLFIPGARLIPTGVTPQGDVRHRVLTPKDYADNIGPQLERGGFFEREIHREAHTYGNITQIFSTYESRRAASDPTPFARGINSIQLLRDRSRWWVVTIFWDAERPDNPIPAQFLP